MLVRVCGCMYVQVCALRISFSRRVSLSACGRVRDRTHLDLEDAVLQADFPHGIAAQRRAHQRHGLLTCRKQNVWRPLFRARDRLQHGRTTHIGMLASRWHLLANTTSARAHVCVSLVVSVCLSVCARVYVYVSDAGRYLESAVHP
jgi:hypothetical protein